MSQLDYNEIKEKKVIMYENEPCVVVSSHVARTQMRKPTNQTKLKSLLSGKVFQAVFQATDSAEEVEIIKKTVKYLYKDGRKNDYWFADAQDPKERFTLTEDKVGETAKWLKENAEAIMKIYEDDDENEQIIGLETPIKIELAVKEAPPNVKGDTATGGRKTVTLENGTELAGVPLFIEAGDIIRINTELGEYVERVEKR